MEDFSFPKLLFASFPAAFIGSSIGTILGAADEMWRHPLRRLMGENWLNPPPSLSDVLSACPIIWMISLFGTITGSAIIGAPAIFLLRNWIARHPLVALAVVPIYSALLSRALLGWTISPTAYGGRHYEVLWFYSAGCGIGFVAMIGWSGIQKSG